MREFTAVFLALRTRSNAISASVAPMQSSGSSVEVVSSWCGRYVVRACVCVCVRVCVRVFVFFVPVVLHVCFECVCDWCVCGVGCRLLEGQAAVMRVEDSAQRDLLSLFSMPTS